MTVNELIKQLQDLPFEQRTKKVAIYVNGCISGILDIDKVSPADTSMDTDYATIDTVVFREAEAN